MVDTIRVLIVDDHEMVRHGLVGFLRASPDLECVGEAANGTQAVRLCGEKRPDVVLMDLMMPEMDGIAATEAILSQYPSIRIIALTSSKESNMVQAALQAGAIAYLLKDISIHDLGNAIRAAYQGKPTLSPQAFHSLVERPTKLPSRSYDLTTREIEVLEMLAKGLTNPEIAERLVVSRSTIKSHLSNIFSKMGVASRTEAVTLALQNNLISMSDTP